MPAALERLVDLYEVLKPLGVKTVCFERYKNGCVTQHECRIKDL